MKTKCFIFPIIVIMILLVACSQNKASTDKLNLDFEKIENGFPVGWEIYGGSLNNTVSVDSIEVKSGKYSVMIESNNENNLIFILPHNYNGKRITLSGYIKTENLTDGYVELWMSMFPAVAFHEMNREGRLTGTNDWKRCEITADLYPALTEKIMLGVYWQGKGKIWLDNFKVTIDGKDIQKLKPYKPKPFPAEEDNEFDRGSGIAFPKLDEQKISDLELLGKIWGFLKYHHPAIGEGKYNWDYELFRMLPGYLNTKDNNQRDKVLLRWIDIYGHVPACKTCTATPDSAFLKPGLSWIDNSDMNPKLKALFHNIYLNRYQGNHYYIRMMASVGNPMFLHENDYSQMPYPDAGFRLLALYRYWNMIYFFFPYKHLTDKDWDTVLKEYIPLFITAKNELEYELAATRIIGEVCDTHAGLREGGNKIDSLRGNRQPPFRVRFIENELVVTDLYYNQWRETSLNVGDIITHINGKTVESIVDSIKKYYPASNEAARMRNIADDILRSNESNITVKYLSSGKMKQKELYSGTRNSWITHRYKKNTTQCYKLLDNNIGYITLESIKEDDIPVIKKEFKNTKGIIIDIRNYPSTNILHTLTSYFVSDTTPFVKFTKGNINNPGEFSFTSSNQVPKSEKSSYKGKLVVIVNEETQSAAEFDAMAFRAGDNTTIIGSQTAGADGNVSEIVLPGGLKTRISGIGIYYPDGKETQRIGIVPDIEVKPTIKGIREGRDEVLEKAIEIIEQETLTIHLTDS